MNKLSRNVKEQLKHDVSTSLCVISTSLNLVQEIMPQLLAGYVESQAKRDDYDAAKTDYIRQITDTIEISQLEVKKILSRINAFVLDD